ncbi:uncharacterized protein ACBR49_001291 [Aulostomus maculatus]
MVVSEWSNVTALMERPWRETEKLVLVAVLGVEMVMGVVGNCLILMVKVMCKGQFSCHYWLPFISLTLSDLGCSLLIISGSLFAILTGGQRSPWCEVVSLLKFAFITSSIGSIAVLCVQRLIGVAASRSAVFVVMVTACLASWVTGVVFGSVPVVYDWIRYDPAEMLCAVFWESSYSDMLVYIVCAFSICIFLPLILILFCSLLSAAGCCRNCKSLTAVCRTEFFSLLVLALGSASLCWFLSVLTVQLPPVGGSRSCKGCCSSCMSLTSFTAASSLLVCSDEQSTKSTELYSRHGLMRVVYSMMRSSADFDQMVSQILCCFHNRYLLSPQRQWGRLWRIDVSDVMSDMGIALDSPMSSAYPTSRVSSNTPRIDDEADLSAVTPLLVSSYILCYTPFAVSELILLGRLDLSPAPDWLRTLSSVMSYLGCGLNPLIYCSHQEFRQAGLALLWTNRKAPSEPVLTAITKCHL